MKDRSNFSNKLGFVLAAAGSAVGLGNIWRFPYLAAQYGGGTFLLIYLILAVTFGFTLMTAEIALGRKTGLSAIGAFRALDKRFNILGILHHRPVLLRDRRMGIEVFHRVYHRRRQGFCGRYIFYGLYQLRHRADRLVPAVYGLHSHRRPVRC